MRVYRAMHKTTKNLDFDQLVDDITHWAKQLGFHSVGVTDCNLADYTEDFQQFLAKGFHGEMAYLARNVEKRLNPEQLVPKTLSIISVTMPYLPASTDVIKTLRTPNKAYISRYALGGDYHKFIRKKLTQLAKKINQAVGEFGYRAFTDSAPILEKPLAEKAGLGWIGKNTLLLNQQQGSWFFLGELFTDLPLAKNQQKMHDHCGNCQACLKICPTQAIVAPYQIDARRCISYLTIELKGSIPVELRSLIGNRIYGCDDCQLICPWNRYAQPTNETQFHPRQQLENSDLITLFTWDEKTFLQRTEGSAIRRIGHERWLRNIAVALGNAPHDPDIIAALTAKQSHPSALVKAHVTWALTQQQTKPEAIMADKKLKKITPKLNPYY